MTWGPYKGWRRDVIRHHMQRHVDAYNDTLMYRVGVPVYPYRSPSPTRLWELCEKLLSRWAPHQPYSLRVWTVYVARFFGVEQPVRRFMWRYFGVVVFDRILIPRFIIKDIVELRSASEREESVIYDNNAANPSDCDG